ncbi:MAG TPA: threonine/serine dehydratase [Alphaproteobacteria bacterium]|nr:threonine/serine dehydratase [Alphaproteobacteria bacterium]
MFQRPTFADVLRARRVVSRYLPRTPLLLSRSLSASLGFQLHVKYENHQPIGAFKVRGGLNLVSALGLSERERGVITASTGNHGQSIAYAARTFGVRAVIVMPEESNPDKVEAMAHLGAEILFWGRDFEEARLKAEQMAHDQGLYYVHPANEPLLIAGVGTIGLEILEDLPEVQTIIVPIGAGSGVCGTSIVAKSVNPQIRIIGVQAEKAPSVYLSWKAHRLLDTPDCDTFAEGLATRTAFELPLSIMQDLIDDIVLVSEDELKQAIVLLLEKAHTVAEGAGAASTAAAVKLKDELHGQHVVCVLSGGNLPLTTLQRILAEMRPLRVSATTA